MQQGGGGGRAADIPLATLTFLGINIGIFILQMLIPMDMGMFAIAAAPILQGQVYRIVTAALMHLGLMHILMNMMSFFYMGIGLVRLET